MIIDRYLRKHWVNREYDCWSLVRDFYVHEYNIELPLVPVDGSDVVAVSDAIKNSECRLLFCPIDVPVDGAVVEMQRKYKQPGKTVARHVGIYIEPGCVLHNNGVVRCLSLHRLSVDWEVTGYFLHVSDSRLS